MRPGGASLHEISEIIGADEVFKEPGGLVTGFALPAPRRSREDLIAGPAALCASCTATAAAEGDGISRAAACLAEYE